MVARLLPLLVASVLAGRAEAAKLVRGLDGQRDLLIERGRSLRGLPLGPGGAIRVAPIDKARWDARRIWQAPRLDAGEKVARTMAVVRARFPLSAAADRRYTALSARSGPMRLAELVALRAGVCRERAFLLQRLLREAGIQARVRYGELYTAGGEYLAGHAWVEARIGGVDAVLDPSVSDGAVTFRPVRVRQKVPGGRTRHVLGAETADHLYVP